MTAPFAQIVRQALDDLDSNPGQDFWRVYDSDALTRAILEHMTAAALARVKAEESEDADAA